MRASDYSYDIEIYGYDFTSNDYGEEVPSYALKYEEYAAKSQVDGREDVEGVGEEKQKVYTRREIWTIRDAGQNITTRDELRHNGESYDIINVEIINDRIIEITTKYVG
jgi:hypothetical protein